MANKVLSIDTANIEDGSYLMMDNKSLVEWTMTDYDLAMKKLSNGREMFHRCTSLTSFYDNLSSLTNG